MTRVADLKFVLPGTWISIDLRGGEEVVARRIKQTADATVGRGDELATPRRAVRDALTAAAAEAKTVRADHLHLAQSIMDGIPMSATLTVSRPGVALPDLPQLEDRQESLRGLVPGTDPVVVDRPDLAVVKSTDAVEAGTEPDGSTRLKRLTANYWIQTASSQLVVFSFSSSMPGLDDELLQLFDAIISSVRQQATAVDE